MSKRPPSSRWGRLPATFRSGDKKMTDPSEDLQRLTLYLPAGLLDRAEAQARQAGAESMQVYCEALLRRAIEMGEEPRHPVVTRTGPDVEDEAGDEGHHVGVDWIDEVASDPEYLAGLASAAHVSHDDDEARPLADRSRAPATSSLTILGEAVPRAAGPGGPGTDAYGEASPEHRGGAATSSEAAAVLVLQHAGLLGEFPEGLIPALRRGEPVAPGPAQELLQALIDLEGELQDAEAIDRRLAFALHRLAFEGQLLVSEAWPGDLPDPGTVETLRLVQEAVDRVLSGEDIRYYRHDEAASGPTVDDGEFP